MPKELRGGYPTFWREFGHGPREALMIHCSLSHSGAWTALAGELSDMLHMTAFDIPGHGRSEDWDNRDDIQAVTTAMAADFPDGPVDVIGHSFGGTVALRLAIEHPHLVRSLTLIEPVFFAVAFADVPGLKQRHHDREKPQLDAMARGDMTAAAQAFNGLWGDADMPWDSLPEQMRANMTKRFGAIISARPAVEEDSGYMLRSGNLEKIPFPTLLLEGAKSPEILGLVNEGLQRRLPDARREILPDSGHMLPITHPQQVGALIREFLETVPAGVPA
ncbi:Pimeloyl-ACP methyl ester carboxylesterase [Thalassovita litoralis]|jgi:pimeloyl-ACP methyl ester carboxylesterase|uniref:Pimeloyl-ACP methyl ester carboxylesterase n=1 Tax=Thalassovita litoralis TaxID=1010611 RepID=A0A521EX03_9RHOB|nr:alpha/beta hydrolase [Thalassovita litoralis]SMO87660.1 Pimeloyl-ACP methyl ester carboxylesterase [Thalassovita litoralis]